MLKTVIVLPDGTELSSGAGSVNAILSSEIIECVNSGEELTIGSTCCNSIEAKLFTPSGKFTIENGAEIKVEKEDESGNRTEVGVFILEKPTRLTANTMKIVGYDRVSKLDKDLTAWLAGLDGWPYSLHTFAGMICDACDVPYTDDIGINLDYQIEKFTRKSVTGRQLMKWLAEIACSFCRADPEGIICFSWYTPADAQITPTGDSYYFQNGLSYEDYVVAPVEAVQVRLADSENGALWPPADEGANSYVITGNPILTRNLDQEILRPVLDNILARLSEDTYTPCKVSIPASMNIHAGNTVQITDKNGVTFIAYVMTKTQTGQKDTLESTGSVRRDSSSAVNNKTQAEKDAAMEDYADSAANKAVKAQTADEVLRRLTNDYQIQGLWQENGEWYFNAQAVHVLDLVAGLIKAGKLQGTTGNAYFDLDSGQFSVYDENKEMNMSGGYLVGFHNNKQVVSLWPENDTSGRLTLGKCVILGNEDRLWIYTRNAQTREKIPLYAEWKELTYKDENGVTQTVMVLAGTPS